MEDWNTQTKVLVVASLFVAIAAFITIFILFFNGPNKEGGHNIAVYLDGRPMDVSVYSNELGHYIYKNLKNGQNPENILDLSPNRIGQLGGILRIESPDWDRNIRITFHDADQQFTRNVIDTTTGQPLKLYIRVNWHRKISTKSGWSIMIHAANAS